MRLLSSALLSAALLFSGPVLAEEAVRVLDPWVRAAPPTAQVQAAYMILQNPGKKEKSLVSAGSPLFAKVEIHETIQHDGQSHMRAKPGIAIAPGSKVQLAPGGMHIMLISPQKALQPKDRVPITLKFADGSEVPVSAEVRAASDKNKDDMGDHKHH